MELSLADKNRKKAPKSQIEKKRPVNPKSIINRKVVANSLKIFGKKKITIITRRGEPNHVVI